MQLRATQAVHASHAPTRNKCRNQTNDVIKVPRKEINNQMQQRIYRSTPTYLEERALEWDRFYAKSKAGDKQR